MCEIGATYHYTIVATKNSIKKIQGAQKAVFGYCGKKFREADRQTIRDAKSVCPREMKIVTKKIFFLCQAAGVPVLR